MSPRTTVAVVIPQPSQGQPERAGSIADQAQVVIGVADCEPSIDLGEPDLGESRFVQETLDPLRARHAERSRGRWRRRRWDVTAQPEADASDRDPRVALHRAPDSQRHCAARAQHSPRLGERRRRIQHQHVAEPAEHTVDRLVVERDALGVDHLIVDIAEAQHCTATARGVKHRRREVAGDQVAAPTDDVGRLEASVANPCRKLEERVSLLWIEFAQHPLADRRRERLDLGAPLLPRGRDPLGDVEVRTGTPARAGLPSSRWPSPSSSPRPPAQQVAERSETNLRLSGRPRNREFSHATSPCSMANNVAAARVDTPILP